MARETVRYKTVKRLKRYILTLAPLYQSQLVRHVLVYLCRVHTIISSYRYWNRYPGDRTRARFNEFGIDLFETREEEHFYAFRMTPPELRSLVSIFEHDLVFISTGPKPQAPPLYQIGLLLY